MVVLQFFMARQRFNDGLRVWPRGVAWTLMPLFVFYFFSVAIHLAFDNHSYSVGSAQVHESRGHSPHGGPHDHHDESHPPHSAGDHWLQMAAKFEFPALHCLLFPAEFERVDVLILSNNLSFSQWLEPAWFSHGAGLPPPSRGPPFV